MPSIAYRPDIDGLRAVAILSVLFFHIGLESFSGGFIGVDVFFVISGFLITRLIREEVQRTGSFQFGNFYLRRARRLFPALFLVLLVSSLAAFVILSPFYLKLFGESLIYAATYTSNFLFWTESGYFDPEATLKPLLHTWSLGVEEQYYIVWPLFLVLLLRVKKKWLAPTAFFVLGILSIKISLIFSDGQVGLVDKLSSRLPAWLTLSDWIADGQATTFYLLPFRMFEFAIGGILVWFVRYQPRNNIVLEAMLLTGLGLIGYSAITLTAKSAHLPYAVLLPCIGAALSIYAGKAKYAGLILSNKAAVGIGLISYSLYLIHWPLIVFWQYRTVSTLTIAQQVMVVFLSMFLAYLSYRYVEQPFRHPGYSSRQSDRTFVIALGVIATIIIIPANHMRTHSGWPWRMSQYELLLTMGDKVSDSDILTWSKKDCYIGGSWGKSDMFPKNYNLEECMMIDKQKPNIFLLGDSNAAALIYGLKTVYPHVNFLQLTVASCPPLLGDNERQYGCQEAIKYAYKFITNNIDKLEAVLLVSRWYGAKHYTSDLENTIKPLELPREKLVVFGDFPHYSRGAASLAMDYRGEITEDALTTHFNRYRKSYLTNNRSQRQRWNRIATYIDPHDLLCDRGICTVFVGDDKQYVVIARDGSHFTPEGSVFFAQQLRKLPVFLELFNARLNEVASHVTPLTNQN